MTNIKFDNPVSFFLNEEKAEKADTKRTSNKDNTTIKPKHQKSLKISVETARAMPTEKTEFKLTKLEKLYSPREASKIMDLHIASVLRKIKEGKIKAQKKGGSQNGGGRYFIPESQILAYLNGDNDD